MVRVVDPRRRLVQELAVHTARRWWFPVLRGVLAAGLGVVAVAAPLGTVVALVRLLGVFVLLDGVLGVLRAARSWGWPGAGLLLVQGVGGLGAGLLLLLQPALTAQAVLVHAGLGAVVVGVVTVVLATGQRDISPVWTWSAAGGVVVAVFGVVLLLVPAAVVGTLAVLVGAFAVVLGAVNLAEGLRLRRLWVGLRRRAAWQRKAP